MTALSLLPFARLFLGFLGLAAIGTQLVVQVRLGHSLVNFFSFFTNLSNLFAAVVLLFGARRLFALRPPTPLDDRLRAANVVNMSVVGIVFAVLLRDVDLGSLLPWVNFVLHYVMPVAVVLEWLLQPPRTQLGMRMLLVCQVFPMCYLAYTLVRGAAVGWYPYPFLDPVNVGGYGGVAVYGVGIALLFLLAAGLWLAIGNRSGRGAVSAAA